MNASVSDTGAKLSSTEVRMWIARNTSASSEALRCSPSITKRGQRGRLQAAHVHHAEREGDVSSTSATAPVERVRYQ